MENPSGGGSLKKKPPNTRPISDFFFKKPKTDVSHASASAVRSTGGVGDPCTSAGNAPNDNEPSYQFSTSSVSLASESAALETNPSNCASACPHVSSDTSVVNSSSAPSVHQPPLPLRNPDARHQYDIGLYVGKVNQLDDFTKKHILREPWTPDSKYVFPFSLHVKNGKEVRRFVSPKHLAAHHWLTLSDIDQGLYCKYCVLFAQDFAGRRSNTPLSVLVKKPLTSFAKLYGKDGALTVHEQNRYHLDAVVSGKAFLLTFDAPDLEVANQINAQRLAEDLEKRARLRPIVETIIFCGQQNIALRGHRDDGSLADIDPEECGSIVANDGNFRALLRFRVASGDTVLKNHLQTANSKATHISKTTQNEIIDCCRDEITHQLCERVRQANWFSIIFDETTDAARIEQMSLSLRYVYQKVIYEDFLTFVDCYQAIRPEDVEKGEKRLTGKALAHIVLDTCKQFDLDINKCVGVGTDNCSVMASDTKGAVREIRNHAPLAVRCPCFNHSLNNSLKKSNDVLACKTCVSKMKEIISFSNSSAKLNLVFKRSLGGSFSGLCETRWQEKHDGVLQFCRSLPAICEALEEISQWQSSETSSKAYSLLKSVCDSEFIVTTFVLGDVLAITRPLSKILQTPSLDSVGASNALRDTLSVLQARRATAEVSFNVVFQNALEMASKLEFELLAPRVARRQGFRANHPSTTVEEYFRRAVYIPVLDVTVNDLNNRFPEEVLMSYNLRILQPCAMDLDTTRAASTEVLSKLKELAKMYESAGVDPVYLQSEYTLWLESWRRQKREGRAVPVTVLEVLDACDSDMFSNINVLLCILTTLPVSVATAERSFSTLRRLKTWLRTRMAEKRLNGLALLHIHRNLPCTVDAVLDRYLKGRKRKLQ